jgi:predicted acylesterase/phospholipase RssA
MTHIKQYKGICLGSGAACGYYMLGALHYLWSKEPEKIKNVKYFCGTSVGGLVATMLAIGYTPMEIFSYICKFDIGMVVTPTLNLKKALDTWGIVCKVTWKNYLTSMVRYKWSQLYGETTIPTYNDVYKKTGNTIICPTYKIHPDPECIYSSHLNTPDLNIVDGLLMTTCIPGLFEKCEINNSLYIDGAVVDSCPVEYLLKLIEPEDNICSIRFGKPKINSIDSFADYLKRIVALFELLQKHEGTKTSQCDNIIIKTEIGQLTLNIDINKRLQYFNQGKLQVKEFFYGKEKIE